MIQQFIQCSLDTSGGRRATPGRRASEPSERQGDGLAEYEVDHELVAGVASRALGQRQRHGEQPAAGVVRSVDAPASGAAAPQAHEHLDGRLLAPRAELTGAERARRDRAAVARDAGAHHRAKLRT